MKSDKMKSEFKHVTFGQRFSSMLAVDTRRMFTQRLLWIMLGTCLVIPILILVMTTAVGGAEMFASTWSIIGTVSGSGSAMSMDMTSMCNINLVYFAAAVLVSLFVTDDFKSGYAKNLFAVRAKRSEYVYSKFVICFIGCALMLLAFFVGSVLGGAIAGLPMALEGVTIANLVMCMMAKIFLMGVFVAIFLAMSILAKTKTWLGMICSFMVGMLLFMMIPSMTPLNATIVHAGMCLAGGAVFGLGISAASTLLLKKRDLV